MDEKPAKKKKLDDTDKHSIGMLLPNETQKTSESLDVKKAERRIQDFLILQAWRHQRKRNNQLGNDVKSLSNQVESLQLQIYTLKQLLDAEKARVVHVNNDLRKILNALEDCKHEKRSLIKEKEQLELRMHIMEDRIMGLENECKNQKNELITSRNEAHNWEKQLEKEREKLIKMKDERRFFIEEVRFKGNLLVWQIRSFEQLSRLFNILQSKPNNPALPWDETLARFDLDLETFKRSEKNLRKQTVVIVEKPLGIPGLKAVLPKAERKTVEEDVRSEDLEKSILGKTSTSKKSEFRLMFP